MARQSGLSTWHFARAFRAATGLSPGQYVLGQRIGLAKRLFQTTDLSVWDIAWSAGFENISHFRRIFSREVGLKPGDFRTAIRNSATRRSRLSLPVGDNRRGSVPYDTGRSPQRPPPPYSGNP
jgi:transcriptional regulator GlxA family with amidase domain